MVSNFLFRFPRNVYVELYWEAWSVSYSNIDTFLSLFRILSSFLNLYFSSACGLSWYVYVLIFVSLAARTCNWLLLQRYLLVRQRSTSDWSLFSLLNRLEHLFFSRFRLTEKGRHQTFFFSWLDSCIAHWSSSCMVAIIRRCSRVCESFGRRKWRSVIGRSCFKSNRYNILLLYI